MIKYFDIFLVILSVLWLLKTVYKRIFAGGKISDIVNVGVIVLLMVINFLLTCRYI